MQSPKKYPLLILIFYLSLPLQAQQYVFRTYGLEEGLPQSEAWTIFQDSRKHLWVGTNAGGLARFTGNGFEVFTKKSHGLVDNQPTYIYEAKDSTLWIGTFRGISHYDGKRFTNYTTKDGVIDGFFYTMWEDDEDRLWTFIWKTTNEQQLGYFKDDKWNDITENIQKTINQNQTFFAFPIANGRALITAQGKWYDLTKKQTLKPSSLQPISSDKNVTFIPLLLDNNQEELWLQANYPNQNSKLYRYHLTKKTLSEVVLPNSIPINFGFFQQDSQNRLWFNTNQGQVLYCYDEKKITTFTKKNGLPQGNTSAFLEDHEGNIWIATRGSGILRFQGEQILNFTKEDGLNTSIARHINQDKTGKIWLGLVGSLASYDGENIQAYLSENKTMNWISSSYEMEDGKWLLGTVGAGLLLFDGENAQNVNQLYGLSPNLVGINDIVWYKNHLWIATSNQGIAQLTDSTNIFYNQASGHLRGNFIQSLFVDTKEDNLWICTTLGLVKYDGKTFTNYTTENGLPINLVLQATADELGNIWIATYGEGLVCFNGKEFIQYSEENGLASNIVYSVATDNQNNIWLGTQKGVDKISLDEKGFPEHIRNFNKQDGLLEDETNGNAIFIDKDNYLWVGTLKGFSRIKIDEKEQVHAPPVLKLNQISLFSQPVNWKKSEYQDFYTSLIAWSQLPEKLILPYDSNHVTFSFEAVSFHSPEKVKFQWKLENFDADWSPISNKTEAVYSNLPPGKYTFLLKAQNAEGIWTENPLRYSFEIQTPFWQRWWFRIGLLGTFIGLTFGGFRWRIRAIESKKRKLEALVRKKTAEIQEQNDKIMLTNAELKQQQEEIITQNEQINQQNVELEQKNQDIQDSLNYAQQIQQAMFPHWEQIQKHLPDSFIFFRPLEVVSGDFYWFAELPQEGKLFLAAVDCTGHGVPGAFMSMMGDTYLNQLVKENKITDPALILEKLHYSIRRNLQQSENTNRDGMDIVLVAIDKQKKELQFAGAKNPLVYFQDEKLHEIKGHKFSIGGFQFEEKRTFETHTISIEKPTTFYLYSDGYQDQFGGREGRKFMVSQFRELLREIHPLPMSDQYKIVEEKLDKWMREGRQEQIDDILVWGAKV